MSDNDTVRLREGAVAWQEIDGETVLLDLSTSEYLGVNQAGTLLWPALTEGTTRVALATSLEQHFGITAEQATTDVDTFLADCRERGLLRP